MWRLDGRRAGMAALLTIAGCGRFGFDAASAPGDARGDGASVDDAAPDAPDAAVGCAFDRCERFETGLGDWIESVNVAVDPTVAHTGSGSLRATVPASAAGTEIGAFVGTTVTDAQPIWLRAYVRFAALPAGGNRAELFTLEQSQAPKLGDFVFVHSDVVSIYDQFTTNVDETTAPAAVDPWLCFVWQVAFSETDGAMSLTGDVSESLALTNVQTTDAASPIDHLYLGLFFATTNMPDPQPALTAWFDDVIIHHAPVTCAD